MQVVIFAATSSDESHALRHGVLGLFRRMTVLEEYRGRKIGVYRPHAAVALIQPMVSRRFRIGIVARRTDEP